MSSMHQSFSAAVVSDSLCLLVHDSWYKPRRDRRLRCILYTAVYEPKLGKADVKAKPACKVTIKSAGNGGYPLDCCGVVLAAGKEETRDISMSRFQVPDGKSFSVISTY